MRNITRAIIFTVTVLASYLCTGLLEEYLLGETERFRPVTATLLGMGVIVLIFVPVFSFTERITESVVAASLKQTSRGAGRIIGIVLFTLLVFATLFSLYLNKWFGLSVGDVL